MITYKDMTFCVRSSRAMGVECGNVKCERYFTEEDREKAVAVDLPVAWSDMKTADCGFVERKKDGH